MNLARLKAKYYAILGVPSVVVVPLTAEVLVFNPENKEIGWENLSGYFYKTRDNAAGPAQKHPSLGVFRRVSIAVKAEFVDGRVVYTYVPIVEVTIMDNEAKLADPKIVESLSKNKELLNRFGLYEMLGAEKDTYSDDLNYFKLRKSIESSKDFQEATRKLGLKKASVNEVIIEALSHMGLHAVEINGDIRITKTGENGIPVIKIAEIEGGKKGRTGYTAILGFSKYDPRYMGYSKDKNKPNYVSGASDVVEKLIVGEKLRKGESKLKYVEKLFNPEIYKIMDCYYKTLYVDNGFAEKTSTGYLDDYIIRLTKTEISYDKTTVYVEGIPDFFVMSRRAETVVSPALANPLGSLILLILDTQISLKLQDMQTESAHTSTKVKNLAILSVLYSYRLAILYGMDPTEIKLQVEGVNGLKEVSLHDIYLNIKGLENLINSDGTLKRETFTINGNEINVRRFIEQITGFKINSDGSIMVKAFDESGTIKEVSFNEILSYDRHSAEFRDAAVLSAVRAGILPDIVVENIQRNMRLYDIDAIKESSLFKVFAELYGCHVENHPSMRVLQNIMDLVSPNKKDGSSKSLHTTDAIKFYRYLAFSSKLLLFKLEVERRIAEELEKGNFETAKRLLELRDEICDVIDRTIIDDIKKIVEGEIHRDKAGYPSKKLLIIGKLSLFVKNKLKEYGRGILNQELMLIVSMLIIDMVFSVMITAMRRYPDMIASLLTDEQQIFVLGLTLTTVVLVIFNSDLEHLIGEGFAKFENPLMLIGFALNGLGTFLSSFGAPFYQGKELVLRIGKEIGKVLGETAEYVWNTVAGFEIPIVEQTVFETVVNLALGGWRDTIAGLVMGGIISLLNSQLEKYLGPIIADITIEYLANNAVS